MTSLALLGFATIGAFLGLILLARTPVIVALVLTPIVAAVIGGFAGEIGRLALEGLTTVAPVAVMIMFAVLYFGLMIDVGLFEPLVRGIVSAVKEDPVRLCLASAALPMVVALDGDGATTFLISITALAPVHRRMGINPLVLPGIVALAAGVMNLLPWGGPTARAMAVLEADVRQIFLPVLPAMLAGVGWVFCVAWWLGRGERRRLAGGPTLEPAELTNRAAQAPVDARFWFNAGLTLLLIVLLFQGLYGQALGLRRAAAGAALHGRLHRRPAGQPAQRQGPAGATLVARGECRPGHLNDLRGWRLHRHPERDRHDQGHGGGAGVRRALCLFPMAEPAGCAYRHAAEPGLHARRLLLRRAAGFRPDGGGGGPRSTGDRQGRDPWPNDDGLSAEPAHRLDLHPRRPVAGVAARPPTVRVQMGVRQQPG